MPVVDYQVSINKANKAIANNGRSVVSILLCVRKEARYGLDMALQTSGLNGRELLCRTRDRYRFPLVTHLPGLGISSASSQE